MLRICGDSKTLRRLSVLPPESIDVAKRNHLLNCVTNAPDVLFNEIDENFVLLGSNLPGFDPGDSIDLLAVDPNGSITVIELSGRAGQQQLMRALSHAALISKSSRDRLLTGVHASQIGDVNRRQRIILAASAFDDDALVAAEWLCGTHGVDITCIRVTVIFDSAADSEYLECDRVFPVKEHRGVGAHAVQQLSPPTSVDRAEDADFGSWADLAGLSEGVGWR